MKNFTRILALLLVCVMLLPAAIACKKEEEEAVQTSDTVSTLEEQTGKINKPIFEMTGLEERDISGEIFVIRYSTQGTWAPAPVDVSRRDANVDTVKEAGYNRDKQFEELTGCELSYEPEDTNPNDFYGSNSEYARINILIQGGDISDYDMLMISSRCAGMLITEQALTDLNEYDNLIHHDREYYNATMNEQLSIGGKQFAATGYYTTGNIRGTQATRVNFDTLSSQHQNDKKVDELYQMAIDHKWTFEALLACNKDYATGDVNEDKTKNTYAFTISQYGSENLFWILGGTLVDKNEQGIPEVALNKETNVNILDYIREKISENPVVCMPAESGASKVFVDNKQSMFVIDMLGAYNANDSINDRLLPVPLMEEGGEYRSFLPTWNSNVFAIPAACADPEHAAYCIELYMAMSYQNVYPEFYEKTFAVQYVENHVESQIFDIINKSMCIDIAQNFGWLDKDDTSVRTMVYSDTNVISSKVASVSATINTNINKFLGDYEF
jgi:hypothetical protein